jgi:hypothetical protein
MAVTVTTKQHDTKITFKDTPKVDGVALTSGDLAGCTLSFILKSTTVSIKQAAVILGDATFSYDPAPADVSTTGDYQQEWEVVYPSGKILTFPNTEYNTVKIITDLG